jgi:hypothetical protein
MRAPAQETDMNRQWGPGRYTTRTVTDNEAGSAGGELYCEKSGKTERAADVIYWDASGQFYVRMFTEIPLVIVEELIREAKQVVKTE